MIPIKLLRNAFSISSLRLQEAALTSSLNKPVEGGRIGRQLLLKAGVWTWPRQAPLVIYFKLGWKKVLLCLCWGWRELLFPSGDLRRMRTFSVCAFILLPLNINKTTLCCCFTQFRWASVQGSRAKYAVCPSHLADWCLEQKVLQKAWFVSVTMPCN